MRKLRAKNCDLSEEIDEICQDNDQIQTTKTEPKSEESASPTTLILSKYFHLFKFIELRPVVLLTVLLSLAQQSSGIINIFQHSETMLKKQFHIEEKFAEYAVLILSLMNILGSLVSFILIERLGRKRLLMYSIIAYLINFLCMISILAFSNANSTNIDEEEKREAQNGTNKPIYAFVFLSVSMFSFGSGLGPVPFVYTAECFKLSAKNCAMSYSIMLNFTLSFTINLIYSILINFIQIHYVLILNVFFLLGILFTIRSIKVSLVVKSKNKNLKIENSDFFLIKK